MGAYRKSPLGYSEDLSLTPYDHLFPQTGGSQPPVKALHRKLWTNGARYNSSFYWHLTAYGDIPSLYQQCHRWPLEAPLPPKLNSFFSNV